MDLSGGVQEHKQRFTGGKLCSGIVLARLEQWEVIAGGTGWGQSVENPDLD